MNPMNDRRANGDTPSSLAAGSITRLLHGYQPRQDDSAARAIFQRVFDDLVRIARGKLSGLSHTAVEDEEDVALLAIYQFLIGVTEGRFAELHDRQDLWQILRNILERRIIDLRRRSASPKRGGQQLVGESALEGVGSAGSMRAGIDQIPDPKILQTLDAAADEAIEERLRQLPDNSLRQIVRWKLEGLTNREIAQRLACVERTVERKLKAIRAVWVEPAEHDCGK
jgi:RNA polymerase sigma factor (sigma-70 family)